MRERIPNPWMDLARKNLAEAVEGLDLDEGELRILRWLDGWDAETLHAVASIIQKARSGA